MNTLIRYLICAILIRVHLQKIESTLIPCFSTPFLENPSLLQSVSNGVVILLHPLQNKRNVIFELGMPCDATM